MKLVAHALAIAVGLTASAGALALDSSLPSYKKVTGISGNLSSVGSDTLANLMTFWSEEYKKQYPSINMSIQAAGSSTAPPALTEGTSNFGPMSRAMKSKEIQAFEQKYGYKPTAIPVAVDALAVFLHKDNPVKGMTIPMVDAIFSSTRKCGYSKDLKTWGDAGLKGNWASRDIALYGRNSVSGTYGYFKKHALCKGDYSSKVKEQPGSAAVVQAVATNPNAIGYSGMGYKVSGVKAIALKNEKTGKFVPATPKYALSGEYPLARFLYVYVNKAPGKPLEPNVAEFLRLVLSKQGQQIVEKDGFVALPASTVAKVKKELGL